MFFPIHKVFLVSIGRFLLCYNPPKEKNSRGEKSGLRRGNFICPPRPIHRVGKWLPDMIESKNIILNYRYPNSGPGSSVGIATDYGLDGPGSNPGWDEIFRPVQTGPGAHPASCTMGTGSFPGVKCGRGVLLTTHPLLVPRSWKSRAIPLPTLWATPGRNGITLTLPFTIS